MDHQISTSKPLQLFLLHLMADKAAGVGQQQEQPFLIVQDNARSHADDQQFLHQILFQDRLVANGTPCNNFNKRQGAARWNDSFEVNEYHQSPKSPLVSPNSVVSLDRLVSPRRRESIVPNSSGCCTSQLARMCHQDKRAITGTTAAFLASLPMDDGYDE